VCRGVGDDAFPSDLHPLVQALVDLLNRPPIGLVRLHPLEVANDDAAGIGQDVRDDENVGLLEDLVGLCRRRAVSAIDDDLGPHVPRIPGV